MSGTATIQFLSTDEQRTLIAAAQDVPCSVVTDIDEATGREAERWVYGRTPAADAAMTTLLERFSPAISAVVRAVLSSKSGLMDEDDAAAICQERFIRAVREHDLSTPGSFSASISPLMRYELLSRIRVDGTLLSVNETVVARYFRLMHKHNNDVRAAYAECLGSETSTDVNAATFLSIHRALSIMETLDWSAGDDECDFSSREAAFIDAAERFDEQIANRDLVRWLFAQVSDREAQILRLRFGFSDLATENLRSAAGFRNDHSDMVLSDREVAQILGSTRPTVQRAQARAISTMRAAMDRLVEDEAA
jgi:RNA polymerase sigma factor (sigma-70 family)